MLNRQLAGRDYLLGDSFTIVDIAAYPWARSWYWAKVDVGGLGGLQAWYERIDARPATRKALTIPKANPAFFGEGDVDAPQVANAARFESDVRPAAS